jgi:hypothetical protein
MARAAGRLAIALAGAGLPEVVRAEVIAAVLFLTLFLTFLLRAGFLAVAVFDAAVRGVARFFADVPLAAAVAGLRTAAFFFAPAFRAAAEVLLAFFTAFFRPPVAEPFRFAITRSFRTPGTSSYLDSYR